MVSNDSTQGMLLKMSPVHDVVDPDQKFPGIKRLFKKILSLLILKKTIQSWAQRQLLKTQSLHLEAECHRLKKDCEELEKEDDTNIAEALKRIKDKIVDILTAVHAERVAASESIDSLVTVRKANMATLKQLAEQNFETLCEKHEIHLSDDLKKVVLECAQSTDIHTAIQEMVERGIALPGQLPTTANAIHEDDDDVGGGSTMPTMEGFFSALFWLAYHLAQGVLTGQHEQTVIPDDVKAMDDAWLEKQKALLNDKEVTPHSDEKIKQYETEIEALGHQIEDLRWKHNHARLKSA